MIWKEANKVKFITFYRL